ncbi:S66 peptidase family protein [Actinomadura verrucosospora]|uniref:Peptidase U61 LD-carboxypeptidase A n=1 Tax=Actinomadura verrucosospora TaxID=46165 RepID=A0A7D3VPI8_ACTVE|nr:LD-carboxypeptidase [Actinomadura verrucosospora]QKG19500.1 peptidase U61 LD-carboxypeptidase A [Actinomadura verrucosospora]
MKSGGARAEGVEGTSDAPAAGVPGERPAPEETRRYGRLRPGDRVAVVAPSGPAEPARLEAGCAVLRDLGLDVVVGKHALDRVNLGAPGPVRDDWHRLAGADADRAADLQAAWCDPRVRAVICARGGYGATRVLDHLDWDALAAASAASAAPKILHGSSDITALHATFGARLGVTTSFGPMPAGMIADVAAGMAAGEGGPDPDGDRAATLDGLRTALFGGPVALPGTHALRPGRAEGPLTGGTLTLITALLGTPYAPPPAKGRIVFLEDVTEAPYRIDRMLVQLLQSGWLDGAAGVALGSWERSGDPAELDAVFTARLGPLGVPVLAGLPAGHGPRQAALELGAPAVLEAAGASSGDLNPRPDGGVLTLEAPGGVR